MTDTQTTPSPIPAAPVLDSGSINTEFPEGDPRRHWPKLEDPHGLLPKVMETYGKATKQQAAQAAGAGQETMTIHQANGYVPHTMYGDEGPVEFWVKLPKIGALTEFQHRMGKFEALTPKEQSTPEGLRCGLEGLLPLLRLLNDDGTFRRPTYEQAGEYVGIEDIGPIVSKAFPPVHPGQELAEAGIVDPKARRRGAKTGHRSTA